MNFSSLSIKHPVPAIMLFVLLSLGLNIVVGFAGLLDLGYVAFYAVGAYVYALLASPHFNLHLPFWVAAGLCAANFCYGWFVLPESLPLDQRTPFSWRRANPLASLKLLRAHPELLGLAGVSFLMAMAQEFEETFFYGNAGTDEREFDGVTRQSDDRLQWG